MSDSIRGLTIEFSADTSKFKKELSTFNQSLNASQKEAKALQDSLDIKFDAEKLKKAQDVVQKAITDTAYKADILKQRMAEMSKTDMTDKQVVEFQKLQAELSKTELSAEKLQQQLKELNNIRIEKLAEGFEKVGNAATKTGQALTPLSVAAGAATAAIGANTLKTIEFADELNTVANQLGITTEELQRFRYMAMQLDVSDEKLTQGFVKLRGTIGEALIGQSNAGTQALQRLGFSLDDLKGKSADQLFTETVGRLSEVEDATIQATLANQIFGERVANDLIPLLKVGGDGLNQLTKEFEAVGYMSDEEVAKLAEFDDTMNRIKATLANIAHQIGIAFLPVFQQIADFMESRIIPALQNLANWFSNLTTGQKDLIVGIGAVVSALAPALLIFGKISSGIGSIIPMLTQAGGALKFLLGPIGIIIGLFALLYSTSEDFRNAVNNLIGALFGALKPVLDAVITILGTLMEALNPIIQLIGGTLAKIISAIVPFIEILEKYLTAVCSILTAILVPVLKILSPILTFVISIITSIIDVIAGAVEWVGNLANSFIDLVYKAIKPALDWLGNLWDSIAKFFGLKDEEVEVTANVNYNQGELDSINASAATQDSLKGTIENNNSVLNTANNYSNANYDYSNKNITVNLTVQNYGAELNYNEVIDKLNAELAKQM